MEWEFDPNLSSILQNLVYLTNVRKNKAKSLFKYIYFLNLLHTM